MINRHFAMFCILFVWCVGTAWTAERIDQKADKELVVESVFLLQKREDEKIYLSKMDLGSFPVGATVRVKATLKNPFEEPIKFSGVSNKCKCKKFKMQNTKVEPGGSSLIEFDIKVPPRYKSKKVETAITLVEKGIAVVRLDIFYALDGLLAFDGFMNVIRIEDVSKTEHRFEIPLLLTPPVDWRKIEVSKSRSLRDVEAEVVNDDGGPTLVAKIPISILKRGNARGELQISYPEGGQKDSYLLSIKDARVHEISPSVLNFKKNVGGGYKATAIVKVAGFGSEQDEKSIAATISCHLNDQEVNMQTKKLSGLTYKVTLRPNAEELEANSSSQIRWEIFNGQTTSSLTTAFVFEK